MNGTARIVGSSQPVNLEGPLWRAMRVLLAVVAAGIMMVIACLAYNHARSMAPSVGVSARAVTIAIVFSSLAAVFVGSVVLVAWFFIFGWRDERTRRRARSGLCAACGYPRALEGSERCSECGCMVADEARGLVRRARGYMVFLTGFGAAVVLGWIVGEACILLDEHRFRVEAAAWEQAGGVGMYCRNRAWPNESSALIYEPGKGFYSTD